MELKPNMYVRTKKGKIYKFESDNSMAKNGAKKYMVNCSYNIIDLIQVGDYVNGTKVDNIILKDDKEICFRYKYAFEKEDVYTLHLKDIKSIVTKESFKSMEYRLGDK